MGKEFIHIIERIKEIKHLASKTDVAKELGLSKENLYGYEKRGKIPLEAILIFCEKENISPTYLLYGTERVPSRAKIHHKYGMEFEEEPIPHTTTAEKHADVYAQVREIMESDDDFVIKALRERLKDYKMALAMNSERRNINQRLARVEAMIGKIAGGTNPPGERISDSSRKEGAATDMTPEGPKLGNMGM
jgi:transcriptional regulator with XRE-family HTH domain